MRSPFRTQPPFSPASITNQQTSRHLEEDQEETGTCIDIELAETSPYQSGVHFALYACYPDREGVHWQGLCQEPNEQVAVVGRRRFQRVQSQTEVTYNTQYAAADAIYCFHRLRQHSTVDALTLCYELTLPIHQVIEEHFVQTDSLTSHPATAYSCKGDVEAMSLAAKEEALIDRTEAEAFMAECHGWQDVTGHLRRRHNLHERRTLQRRLWRGAPHR